MHCVCVPRCECVLGYVCMCLCVCMCMCAQYREKDLSTPSIHMHISTMDRLQHWVQKRLGGKLIEENLELKHVQRRKKNLEVQLLAGKGVPLQSSGIYDTKKQLRKLIFHFPVPNTHLGNTKVSSCISDSSGRLCRSGKLTTETPVLGFDISPMIIFGYCTCAPAFRDGMYFNS